MLVVSAKTERFSSYGPKIGAKNISSCGRDLHYVMDKSKQNISNNDKNELWS